VSPRTGGEGRSSSTNPRSGWRPLVHDCLVSRMRVGEDLGHQSSGLSLQSAATLLRGFRWLSSTCPRVRGLIPASLPKVKRKNVSLTHLTALDRTDLEPPLDWRCLAENYFEKRSNSNCARGWNDDFAPSSNAAF
jgi:hypothetical protein